MATEPGAATTLLAVNGGSSSLKCRLYTAAGDGLQELAAFRVTRLEDDPRWRVNVPGRPESRRSLADLGRTPRGARHAAGMKAILALVAAREAIPEPDIIAHRIVHGGDRFDSPVVISTAILDALRGLAHLAPLHQGPGLDLVDVCTAECPGSIQVACFDTAFHRRQPAVERTYALPPELRDAGIHKYGFHGISCEYVWRRLRELDPAASERKTVIAHLGAGASLCAVHGGRSVASTMGFSTLDGLPMGTRSGALDPGILLYLMRERGMDADTLEDLLYRRSGLLGLSGRSADLRELEAAADERSRFAIALFGYRIAREIGSLAAVLEGLDTLVFTGGIGEKVAGIRADVVTRCGWLGARLDEQANRSRAPVISGPDSGVTVRIIQTDEEAMLARLALGAARDQAHR